MKAKKGINANSTERQKHQKDKEDVDSLTTGDVGSVKDKVKVLLGRRTIIFARTKKTAEVMKDNFNGHVV